MHQLFDLHAPYQPMGDQPQAIRELVDGVRAGNRHQVLLGATGTGKTFTMANIIQELQIPAVVMVHNKTLAAQLYAEFKEFFRTKNERNRCAAIGRYGSWRAPNT